MDKEKIILSESAADPESGKDPGGTVLISGRGTLAFLAAYYPQLYLRPGEEGEKLYPDVVLRFQDVKDRSLSHFICSDRDLCRLIHTPAGDVLAATLGERQDFENCLRIITARCRMIDIPRTQGASFISGVISRHKIDVHREAFFKENAGEEGDPDLMQRWRAEQERFFSDKKNYTDKLILLSVGPYSNLSAELAGFPQDVWIAHSQTIRTYHECTHFVCRTLYPEKTDAIWDELIADAVGIMAALGHFDISLAEAVLGIRGQSYTGGRLENYIPSDCQEPAEYIEKLLPKIRKAMEELRRVSGEIEKTTGNPFDLAIEMEREKEDIWDESV